jgi:hypothetical protein
MSQLTGLPPVIIPGPQNDDKNNFETFKPPCNSRVPRDGPTASFQHWGLVMKRSLRFLLEVALFVPLCLRAVAILGLNE